MKGLWPTFLYQDRVSMKTQPFNSYSPAEEECTLEATITDWLRATTLFYGNYGQLVTTINQRMIQPGGLAEANSSLGQRSIEPLITLVLEMQAELEKLLGDMDQFALLAQRPSTQGYKKLQAHTRILNHLNHQAHQRLTVF